MRRAWMRLAAGLGACIASWSFVVPESAQVDGDEPESSAGDADAPAEDGVTDAADDDAKPSEDDAPEKGPGPFSHVFSESWFDIGRIGIDLHGMFRVRSNLYHNFSLGRRDGAYDPALGTGTPTLWPQPIDNSYTDTSGRARDVSQCGEPSALEPCSTDLQAGADMRFRFEPSFSISDNVSVHAQIDALDNAVLGSTPQGYANQPAEGGGYQVTSRGGYAPVGAFAITQWQPVAGVTSLDDSVLVKRIWGQYHSPIGTIRFGRMAHEWGLGMMHNAGNTYDSDWQSTVDRISFTTGLPEYNLYVTGAWDFANEGPTSTSLHGAQGEVTDAGEAPPAFGSGIYNEGGQPYDLATKDDVDQWVIMLMHRVDEQLARRDLAKGLPVVNAGVYLSYRQQTLASDTSDATSSAAIGADPADVTEGLTRRGYDAYIGDIWLQLRFERLRFEMEAALIYGTLENTLDLESDFNNPRDTQNDGFVLQQFGIATQTEYRALEDRLRLSFGFGLGSGDSDVPSLNPTRSPSSGSQIERQLTLDRTYSTFRFHPDYRVDLILFRNILTRVQGAYYFRPSIDYDFWQDRGAGQRIGGGLTAIWSRATEPVQAPGHAPDLGLELDLKLHYQVSPGASLNLDTQAIGGFYAALEYGVLFPFDGLGYLPGQEQAYTAATAGETLEISPAQAARLYLGIMF